MQSPNTAFISASTPTSTSTAVPVSASAHAALQSAWALLDDPEEWKAFSLPARSPVRGGGGFCE